MKENLEQPISNHLEGKNTKQSAWPSQADSLGHIAILDFLEHDLGMPLTDKQRYILDQSIYLACRAYSSPHITPFERAELLKKLCDDTSKLLDNMDQAMLDDQLCHFSFSEDDNGRFDLNQIMQLQQDIFRFRSMIQSAQRNLATAEKKPRGQKGDGGSFSLLVLYLSDGWKKAFGKQPATSSSNAIGNVRFGENDFNTGIRGGKFPYFVWVVESLVGEPEYLTQYGEKVQNTLSSFKKMFSEKNNKDFADGAFTIVDE